jgi:predicted enzyme related to lactoylglutathione lyase
MCSSVPERVVHLELHTVDRPAASAFCARLFGWSTEEIRVRAGSYYALGLGGGVGGGIVECGTRRAVWVPYVEVEDVEALTERASHLGAAVLLEPREGPVGWRSVVASREAGEIALWQPKRRGHA